MLFFIGFFVDLENYYLIVSARYVTMMILAMWCMIVKDMLESSSSEEERPFLVTGEGDPIV